MPLMVVGPWPLWPSPPDFIGVVFIIVSILYSAHSTTRHSRFFLLAILIGLGVISASYAMFTLFIGAVEGAAKVGAYQLLRVTEFLGIAYAAAIVPLTPWRARVLANSFALVLLGSASFLLLEYAGVVAGTDAIRRFAQGLDGGAWYVYTLGIPDCGLLGYNHGTASMFVVLFAAGAIGVVHRNIVFEWLVVGLGLAAVVATRSRAGVLAYLVFVLCLSLTSMRRISHIVVVVGMCLGAAFVVQHFEDMALHERYLGEDVGELSGRWDIWATKVQQLFRDPVLAVSGAGFGTAMRSEGGNAHSMYLQAVLEVGVLGAGILAIGMLMLMRTCWRSGSKVAFSAIVAVLFSALTQETIYPVHASLHLPALFGVLCAVSLAAGRDGVRSCALGQRRGASTVFSVSSARGGGATLRGVAVRRV